MNKDIKEEWVAALRSGDYVQGIGFLNDGHKLCCLGVLSELAAKHGVIDPPVPGDDGIVAYDGKTALPSRKVEDWAGLEYGDSGHLASLNDEGKSFAQLADHIEKVF